jgi:hypothetical protein
MVTNHAEGTFESLRYTFGGDHPSQTTHQTLSPDDDVRVRLQINQGRYFKVDSPRPGGPASQSPGYPTHDLSKVNVKL